MYKRNRTGTIGSGSFPSVIAAIMTAKYMTVPFPFAFLRDVFLSVREAKSGMSMARSGASRVPIRSALNARSGR